MAGKEKNVSTKMTVSGEKEYKEACRDINKNLALLNSEMKLTTAEYKENANSIEALKAKQEILQKTYDEQAKKVEIVKKELQEYENAENKNVDAIQKVQKELNYQKAALENTNNALKENSRQQQEAEKAISAVVVAQKRYEEHCKRINENIGTLSSELKVVAAEYKGNETSVEALGKKQEVLAKIFNEQGIRLRETEEMLRKCKEENGEYSDAARKLETDLNNQKAAWLEARDALQSVQKELSEGVQAQRQYEDACQGIDKNLSLLGAALQEVNAKYKGNENGAKAVAEKQGILKKTYDEQAKKVEETKKAYETMARQYGKNSDEAKELETQLHKEKAALYDVESQIEATGQSHGGLASVMNGYEEHCKRINENIGTLSSELKVVAAEYKGNETSVEALGKKQEVLAKIFNEQGIRLRETEEMLRKCKEENGEYSDAARKLETDLNNQKAAWLEARDALQSVQKELSEGVQAQRQYEDACQGIDKNLSLLGAALQEVNAKYKGNENGAKAVAEKQGILKKTYDEQAKKVEETKKAYETMARQYGKNSDEAKELETQLHKEKAALYDVESQIEATGQSHGGLASVMNGLGNAMSTGIKAIGTATAAIGAAVVAGFGYAVSQADEAKGALNDFCAATGTATDEAGEYKRVMEDIYAGNYGEGFEDIAAAMTEVRQQAGNLGADKLEEMTTNALALRDTFEFDVAESTRAATQLMQKFGLTSDEAYNLIAQGARNGLNKNGDLLDVINEYSNQYSQAGLSAEDMFNSIANGAETGVWSIDKMGDAFKEFSIRMNDGTANEYLAKLGLDADEVVGKFQKGGDSAKEAMSQVSEALRRCDDKTLQYTAGVGLMGTMWEDMGADACTSLMDVEGQIDKTVDAMGAINAVKYDTFGEAMQGAGRILQTSFVMPIGEEALPIFSQFANELQQGAKAAGGDMGKMARSFGDALGNMAGGLSEMIPKIADFAMELVKGLADGVMASLPMLTESAVGIVTTLVTGVAGMIPSLADGAAQIVAGLAGGIGNALPKLIPSAVGAIVTVTDALVSNVPMLLETALQLVTGLADGIVAALPVLIESLPEIITTVVNALVEGLPLIIASAGDIMVALVDGVIAALPLLIAAVPQIIMAVVDGIVAGLPEVLGAAAKLVETIKNKIEELPMLIWNAIADGINKIAEWGARMKEKGGTVTTELVAKVIGIIKELPQKIANAITGAVSHVATWGADMSAKAREVMGNMAAGVANVVQGIPQKIWDGITGAVGKIAQWGTNMSAKAREVMGNMAAGVVSVVQGIPQRIWNGLIGAVSKVAAWGTNVKDTAVGAMWNVINGITGAFWNIGSTFAGFGWNIVQGIWNGISNGTQWIKDKISGWVGNVTGFLKRLFGINSPSTLMRDEVGVFLAKGIGVGFEAGMDEVNKQIEAAIPREFDVGAKVNVGKGVTYDLSGDGNPYKPRPRGTTPITVIQNIYANTTDYVKQQKEAARQLKLVARTV